MKENILKFLKLLFNYFNPNTVSLDEFVRPVICLLMIMIVCAVLASFIVFCFKNYTTCSMWVSGIAIGFVIGQSLTNYFKKNW